MTLTDNMLQSIRERLGQLMKDYSLSQKALAAKCGLSENDVSVLVGKNKRDKKTMSGEQLFAIAEAFDVSIDWLVGRTDIREMAHSKEESAAEFDYSKVTYGDLNRMLAFAAACGVLQIVPPKDKNDNVSLLVRHKDTADFLRRLQKKAIDVITDSDETEYLTDWFEKKCAITTSLYSFDCVFNCADKYHGAFPWRYLLSLDKDWRFDFTGAEWIKDNPSEEWDHAWFSYINNCGISYGPYDGVDRSYENYKCLSDGITGYYCIDDIVNAPEPPHKKKTDQTSGTDDFMNIPDGIDEELPFN